MQIVIGILIVPTYVYYKLVIRWWIDFRLLMGYFRFVKPPIGYNLYLVSKSKFGRVFSKLLYITYLK